MLKEALWDRACFSETPIPCENTGETSSMAVGDAVHVHYPHVRTCSSATNRSRSSLSATLRDDAMLEGKTEESRSQGKQLPG